MSRFYIADTDRHFQEVGRFDIISVRMTGIRYILAVERSACDQTTTSTNGPFWIVGDGPMHDRLRPFWQRLGGRGPDSLRGHSLHHHGEQRWDIIEGQR